MARKTGSDYIPTKAELMQAAEERKEYMASHPVKLKKYEISYRINGICASEFRYGTSNSDAIEEFKRQCSMVGWIPYDVTCKEVEQNG